MKRTAGTGGVASGVVRTGLRGCGFGSSWAHLAGEGEEKLGRLLLGALLERLHRVIRQQRFDAVP